MKRKTSAKERFGKLQRYRSTAALFATVEIVSQSN